MDIIIFALLLTMYTTDGVVPDLEKSTYSVIKEYEDE
jgi:hypothetical protein